MARDIYFLTINDPYFELSNYANYGFEADGHYWLTVEHYYQAAKFENTEYYEKIKNARSPKQAKDLGKTRAVPIKKDWEDVKEEIMLSALRKKSHIINSKHY
jgi:ribA/ribD-fused uncharacterized protein